MEVEIMETMNKIEEQHSVKIAINAKGLFSGEAKCYGATPEEAMARTKTLSKELESIIRSKNEK
jgi:hypothetical protein